MSLFGRGRDINFFRSINKELLHNIIEQYIGYYKISLKDTSTNLYGESIRKTYKKPVRIACLITRGDTSTTENDFGSEAVKDVSFAFYKEDLQDAKTYPEIGDIILWNENFYEVDNINENQLVVGKDPDIVYDIEYLNKFGQSLSIICSTHLTNGEKLGLKKFRL